ncbi:MAG: hypothetical protein JF616_10080 [Fibrobacteres bacterium]|jgi:hypothetical protein|nr:hypothetical protein [Fibrobacterota bacterium]
MKKETIAAAYAAEAAPDQAVHLLAALGVMKHYLYSRCGRIPAYGDQAWYYWMEYGGGMKVWKEPSSSPAGRYVDDEKFRIEVLSRFLTPASVEFYRNSPQFHESLTRLVMEAEQAKRDLPKVFGLVLGGQLIEQMPNCANQSSGLCFQEMRNKNSSEGDDFSNMLFGSLAAAAGAWQPDLLGDAVKLVGVSVPDWVASATPMVGQIWNSMLVAVQVRASARDANFREDLVEKFGPPTREIKTSFRNTYGKAWTAPEMEWKSNDLHVQFVLDQKQDDEQAWGVLLIENAVAYKARAEYESKQKKQRTKL